MLNSGKLGCILKSLSNFTLAYYTYKLVQVFVRFYKNNLSNIYVFLSLFH